MIGIYEIDFDTLRFLNVDQHIPDRLGYTKEELMGQSVLMVLTPESLMLMNDRIARLRNGEHLDGDVKCTVISKSGEIIKVSLEAFYKIRQGRITGALVAVREIP